MIDRKGFIKRRFGLDDPGIERIAMFRKQIMMLSSMIEDHEVNNRRLEADIAILINKFSEAKIEIAEKNENIMRLQSNLHQQALLIDSLTSICQERNGWMHCMKRLWEIFKS